jgi:hypothetical protein
MKKIPSEVFGRSSKLWQTIHRYDDFHRKDFTIQQIKRIESIVDYLFNTEVTGIEMELEYSENMRTSDKVVDIETWFNKKRFKSEVTFRVKEKITGIVYGISFTLLEDNYFQVWALMPYNSRYYPNGFMIQDFTYLIDGWDGLKEWATEHQVAKGDKTAYAGILLLDKPNADNFSMVSGSVAEVASKYPSVKYYMIDRTFFFKQVGENQFAPYACAINNKLYLYRTEDDKKEMRRLKSEHDRLYNIYSDILYGRKLPGDTKPQENGIEHDLTQEEQWQLMSLLSNTNLRGSVESSSHTLNSEEDLQKAQRLVDKLVKTARPRKVENESLRYLIEYTKYK